MDENILEFFSLAGKMKKEKRSGWLDRKIPNPESVADHSFRLALMAMVFAKKHGIDSERAVKMALVHDLPEAITGDISTDHFDKYGNTVGIVPTLDRKQKSIDEKKALTEITKNLDERTAKEIFSLWSEFEEHKTKTARFVKDIDILECLLQALEYKRQFPENKMLIDFFKHAGKNRKLSFAFVKEMIDFLEKEYNRIEKEK